MDITVNLTKKNVSESVTLTILFCETDETMLYFIADELESLPSFLEWDTTPSWTALANTNIFECKDNLSFILNSEEVIFPQEVPPTLQNQRVFVGTHALRDDRHFAQYFHTDQFTVPLRELQNLSAYHEERNKQKAALILREQNIKLCRYSDTFQIEGTTLKYKQFVIKLSATKLQTVFQNISLSKEIPFVMYNDIVQTVDYFKPEKEWLELNTDESLIFKIRHDTASDEYSTGVIVMNNDACFCVLDTSDFYKTVDEQALLTVLKTALQDTSLSLIEQSTFLTYDIVGVEFHDCYLADMIMHNLHTMFYIDEYIKPSKMTNRVYIHLTDQSATINLLQKYTQKKTQFNVKPQTPYIAVRIKSETVFMTNRIRYLVSCLLGYYHKHIQKVRSFYALYTTPRPEHENVISPIANKPLKLIAPDIFLPMYSRRCLNMPNIVSEADIQGRPHLRFPAFGESAQRIYVCEHEKYQFPGLRVNELANRNLFPYVPCCYSKDQRLNPDSKLNRYLNQKPVIPKIKHSQGAIYNIPSQLKRYFTYIDTTNEYILLSNPDSPISFLSAVYYALHRTTPPALLKKIIVSQFRPEICAQEGWPVSITGGFSPQLHIRLLEAYFNITIFLFDRFGPMLPSFERLYLKPTPLERSVLIYVKSATHCLPIVRMGVAESFFSRSPLVGTIYSHLERLSPHKFTNQSVSDYFSKYQVVGQILNSDRHCIFFICLIKKTEIPVATDPQIPFSAPIITRIKRLTDPEAAAGLFKSPQYIVTDGTVKELLIPFASQARILTFFPEEKIPGTAITSRAEKYNRMDSTQNQGLYNFIYLRKSSKELLMTLAGIMSATKTKMDSATILAWIEANRHLLPVGLAHETDLLIQKLGYLIHLRHKNGVVDTGKLDPLLLAPKPNTVFTFYKDVLGGEDEILHYKPNLGYLAVKEKIVINKKIFTRIDETTTNLTQFPEVIYNPETEKIYNLDFTESDVNKFKTYINGTLWGFIRV